MWNPQLNWKKYVLWNVKNKENTKILKYCISSIKHYLLLLFAVNAAVSVKEYLKKKNKLKYEKFLVWMKYKITFKIWGKKTQALTLVLKNR